MIQTGGIIRGNHQWNFEKGDVSREANIVPESNISDGYKISSSTISGKSGEIIDPKSALKFRESKETDAKPASSSGVSSWFCRGAIKKTVVSLCLGAALMTSLSCAILPDKAYGMETTKPAVETVIRQEQGKNVLFNRASSVADKAPVKEAKSEAQVVQEAESFGISQVLISKLKGEQLQAKSLDTLMQETRQMFNELNQKQRDDIYKGMNGTTTKLFITINHRDAFIKGSAAGINIFEYMKEKVDQKLNEGKVSFQDSVTIKKNLDYASKLTPQQREVMVQVFTKMYESNQITMAKAK